MGIYLEESRRVEENELIWQTPNRQRYWGLGAMVISAAVVAYSLRGVPRRIENLELVIGSVFLLGSILATTWTVKLKLNAKYQTYEFVKGFLPFLFGEKGPATSAFECVAVRKEEILEGAKDDVDRKSFYSFKVFLVWKDAREAMMLDSFPENYAASLEDDDFHAWAMARADSLSEATGLPVLDQTKEFVMPSDEEEVEASDNPGPGYVS